MMELQSGEVDHGWVSQSGNLVAQRDCIGFELRL